MAARFGEKRSVLLKPLESWLVDIARGTNGKLRLLSLGGNCCFQMRFKELFFFPPQLLTMEFPDDHFLALKKPLE